MNQERRVEKTELARLHREMRLACDMSGSVERLRKLGYSDRAILVAFEAVRPRGNALEPGAIHTPPLIRCKPANLHRIDCDKLELYTLENFLSHGECDRIVALIGHHLHPSKLTYASRRQVLPHQPDRRPVLPEQPRGDRPSTTRSARPWAFAPNIPRASRRSVMTSASSSSRTGTISSRAPMNTRDSRACAAIAPGPSWFISTKAWKVAARASPSRPAVQPKTGMALLWNNLNLTARRTQPLCIVVNP